MCCQVIQVQQYSSPSAEVSQANQRATSRAEVLHHQARLPDSAMVCISDAYRGKEVSAKKSRMKQRLWQVQNHVQSSDGSKRGHGQELSEDDRRCQAHIWSTSLQ